MIRDCLCHYERIAPGKVDPIYPGRRTWTNPECPVHGDKAVLTRGGNDAVQVGETTKVYVRKASEDSKAMGEKVRDKAAAKEEAFPIDERTHSG